MDQRVEQLQLELIERQGQIDPSKLGLVAYRHGLEALGIGGRRMAVIIDEAQIAKVAFRREGLVDNEIEWRLYSRADHELRELLCPAFALTETGALIQGRCLPSSQPSGNLVRQLAQYGISDAAINLGICDQRLVCYDYSLLRPEKIQEIIADEKSKIISLDSLG